MRGYGQTDRPEAIDQYTLLHLVGDMVGLVDALGAESAVIAGHDWARPSPGTRRFCRPGSPRPISISTPESSRGPASAAG
jgi:hypothetical protein